MNSREFEIDGKPVSGFEISLPKAPLVLVRAKEGFVMCGYLNVSVAEKLAVPAAMVRGVSTVDDLLSATIQSMSLPAQEKGVRIGMTGREALVLLS